MYIKKKAVLLTVRADCRRIRGVHLLMVVAGAAVVPALQRRVEEVPVSLWADVAGGRAAVHAAVIPALLQRARASSAALAAHVHDRRTDLTNHASLLYTRTLSPHPYPHFKSIDQSRWPIYWVTEPSLNIIGLRSRVTTRTPHTRIWKDVWRLDILRGA